MNLRIVAKSNRGVFAGIEEDGYVVLSMDDTKDIELGDVLSSATWTDRDGLFKTVQNITKREQVRICIENWSCPRTVAYESLRRLNSATEVTSIEREESRR